MADIYQYWSSVPDGEIYAVVITDDVVSAACGPLDHKDVSAANIESGYNFDSDPEVTEWVRARDNETEGQAFSLVSEQNYYVAE